MNEPRRGRGMRLQGSGDVLSPAVELGKIERDQGRAGGEERIEIGPRGVERRALVPADEAGVAEAGPVRRQRAESGGVASVDGEARQIGESLAEAEGDEFLVRLLLLQQVVIVVELVGVMKMVVVVVVVEEGVAPGGEVGEVEGGDGGEADGQHEDVADVAAKG